MDIEEFFRLATGEIPGPIIVGRVPGNVQRALDAPTRTVFLSRDTLEKQMTRHGELTLSGYYDYMLDALQHGKAFRMPNWRVSLVLDLRYIRERRFNIVVKSTETHDELYAISFHPLRGRDWDRILRKYNPIP